MAWIKARQMTAKNVLVWWWLLLIIILSTPKSSHAMTTQRLPKPTLYDVTKESQKDVPLRNRTNAVEATLAVIIAVNNTLSENNINNSINNDEDNKNNIDDKNKELPDNDDISPFYNPDCKWQEHDMVSWNETASTISSPPCKVNSTRTSFHYSPLYTAVAASLSAIIFFFGFLGNILVIVVISRTRSMHTTTNCYLLSLSVADSLVLLAATLPAIPETFFRVDEWPYGRVMCPLLVFFQYLGVDASSLSITAFTIERYIAICHPMKAQTICTLSRAKKIVALLWIFTSLYCAPWLGLTDTKAISLPSGKTILQCGFRYARSSYLVLYMIDLILFYVIPLIIATILYLLIGRILFLSRNVRKNVQYLASKSARNVPQKRADSRIQVVRMLVVVVVIFATLWMPYRVIVVYNSFAENKYMDLWFLLFARTMVYTNCAINPILYNIMSVKFKRAFRNYLTCWHRKNSLPSTSYNEMATDAWGTRRHTTTCTTAVKHGSTSNSSSMRDSRQALHVVHKQPNGQDPSPVAPRKSDVSPVLQGSHTPRIVYQSKLPQPTTPNPIPTPTDNNSRGRGPSGRSPEMRGSNNNSSEFRQYHNHHHHHQHHQFNNNTVRAHVRNSNGSHAVQESGAVCSEQAV